MIITALVFQTWFDIAIQHTGSVMNAYAIAIANDGRSITDDITPGEFIIIPDDIPILKKEVQYLENKKTIPATGITSDDLEEINPTLGIGTMAIGSTFIVG
jgi:LysM repeat protein